VSAEELNILLPTYLLAACRVAGVVLFAPVLSSSSIPRKVQIAIALGITLGLMPTIPTVAVSSFASLPIAISAELAFGIALGMCANLVFLAAQWAGEMAGQQLGFTLSGIIDPTTGAETSIIGNLYLLLASVVFLLVNGHHALIRGVGASFQSLPLGSIALSRGLFDTTVGLLQSATILCLQLAAPLLFTMLIVDFSLGIAARVIPQMNVMALGMSIRAAVGLILLLILGAVTVRALASATNGWMKTIDLLHSPAVAGGLQ
jgi:flagellar biosynthesis protein FliR